MANTLRFKRGLVAGIPNGALGEPLFTTDTFDLYIGNGTGNTRFQKYIASGATTQILRGDGSLYTFPLNISSPSNGQVLKYDGTNWVNSADAGVTGSGTAGQVTYWGSSSTITGSNNLFWDNTNGRLGIGTNTPSELLNIYRAANTSGALFDSGLASSVSFLRLTNSGASGRSYSINVGGASSGFGTGSNFFIYDNTANATRLLINSSGNILVNSTSDNGLRFQVTGDGFFSGGVGIGTTAITDVNLYIRKNLSGSVFPSGLYIDSTVQSTSTTGAAYISTSVSTQAATFTLPNLYHFRAVQSTFGAGSTVTNQYGYIAESSLIGATNNFGFYGNIASGTGRWNLYMNGTAANYLAGNLQISTDTFFVNTSLNRIGIGTATPEPAFVNGGNAVRSMQIAANGRAGINFRDTSSANQYLNIGVQGTEAWIEAIYSTTPRINYNAAVAHIFYTNSAERMRIFSDGNVGIGTGSTNAGFRLDVNGTMRVSGASTFARITAVTSGINLDFNSGILYHFGGSGDYYQFISGANYFLHNRTATGSLIFGTNGTDRMRIDANGNVGLNVTPSAWSGRAIQIGARASIASVTDDLMLTNNAFYDGTNWKYIQSTLASNYYQSAGVHVWRTAVSGTAGNNITWTEQMRVFANGNLLVGSSATDNGQRLQIEGSVRVAGDIIITGGNGYDVINSGGNTTTALRSTSGGTSIMSSVSNGLHIAVGTENAGDLILASNNTERIRLSSNGFFSQINATNPSSSITDSYIQYSADVTAGNAAPHFRTENGAVIKLYQETTAVGNAIFSQGGGNAVLDDSTFAGYTIRQVVQALRNQGILQ